MTQNKNEYIEPTAGGKIALTVFYSLVIGWFVVAQEIVIGPIAGYVTTLEFCESIPWVRGEVIYGIVAFSMPLLLLLVRAYQIFKYKQAPPPNAYVFRRTTISRSKIVILKGYFVLILALGLIGSLIYVWHYFEISLIFSSAVDLECA